MAAARFGLVPHFVERDEGLKARLVPVGDAGCGREHTLCCEEFRLGLTKALEFGEAAAKPLPGFGGRPEVLALRPFVHFRGLAVQGLGLRGVAALQEQATQVQEVGRRARVAGRVEAPSHRQRLAEEWLCFLQVLLVVPQLPQTAERVGGLLVVAAVERPCQRHCRRQYLRRLVVEGQFAEGGSNRRPEAQLGLRGFREVSLLDPGRGVIHHVLQQLRVAPSGDTRLHALKHVRHELGDQLGLVEF